MQLKITACQWIFFLICSMKKSYQQEIIKMNLPTAFLWSAEQPLAPVAPKQRERFVNLSKLPASEKRMVWEKLKVIHPEYAALLNDPNFKALQEAFGGDIELPESIL